VSHNPPVPRHPALGLSIGLTLVLITLMTETTVSRGSNGQYKVTIPKSIGDGFDLDGKTLDWRVVSGNKLEATISDD